MDHADSCTTIFSTHSPAVDNNDPPGGHLKAERLADVAGGRLNYYPGGGPPAGELNVKGEMGLQEQTEETENQFGRELRAFTFEVRGEFASFSSKMLSLCCLRFLLFKIISVFRLNL